MCTASRSRGSARTSTRSSPCWRRSGGSGPIPSCCSSSRRSPSPPERCRSSGSPASTSRADWPAAALALAYLLSAPVQWLTVSDFHPVALACPLLLFAWWHLDEGRLWAFALLAAAAIATKEHVGLAVAAMGIWYAVRHRAPRSGAAIALIAGSAALLAALVDRPPLRGRRHLGLREPLRVAVARRPRRLLPRLAPAAARVVPARGPLALLAALPELGLNLLSSTVTQTSVKTHYAATIIPALLAATVFGVARLGARFAYVVALAALAGGSCSGRSAASRSRRRARRRRAPCARARPGRCAGQRDEHARCAPLRAPAHLQLPGARARRMGRRRRTATDLPGQPRSRTSARHTSPHSTATLPGSASSPKTGSSSSVASGSQSVLRVSTPEGGRTRRGRATLIRSRRSRRRSDCAACASTRGDGSSSTKTA